MAVDGSRNASVWTSLLSLTKRHAAAATAATVRLLLLRTLLPQRSGSGAVMQRILAANADFSVLPQPHRAMGECSHASSSLACPVSLAPLPASDSLWSTLLPTHTHSLLLLHLSHSGLAGMYSRLPSVTATHSTFPPATTMDATARSAHESLVT